MKKTREPLLVIIQQDGKETRRFEEPNRVIYQKADGTEEVSFIGGRRTISRQEGRAVLTVNYTTARTWSFDDIRKEFDL